MAKEFGMPLTEPTPVQIRDDATIIGLIKEFNLDLPKDANLGYALGFTLNAISTAIREKNRILLIEELNLPKDANWNSIGEAKRKSMSTDI